MTTRLQFVSVLGLALALAGGSLILGQAGANAALRTPGTAMAPAAFKVTFETTAGNFIVDVHRDWSPNGVDRFYNMVKGGYFTDVRFYRVSPNFMVQFGINGDPAVTAAWAKAAIKDDPVKKSNTRGMVTFAKTGLPNSRTTQLFINFKDNNFLDAMGFSPIGQVAGNGMSVVDKLYSGYGEMAEQGGRGPSQGQFTAQGNAYVAKDFPKLDYIKKATITE